MTPELEALLARARQQQGWTPDRIEALKALFLDGLSMSEIARRIGGVTRNAVLGKVHRLGLMVGLGSRHEQTHLNHPTKRAARANVSAIYRGDPHTSPLQKKLDAIMANAAATPLPERHEEPGSATMLTLGAHMCKWPIGDPSSDGFTFCGRRTGEGSYCQEHARVAYQPQHNRRTVRPVSRGELFSDDVSVPKFAYHDALAFAVMAQGGHSRVEESPGRKRLIAADGSILREWAA